MNDEHYWMQRLEAYCLHLERVENVQPGSHRSIARRWIEFAEEHERDPSVWDESLFARMVDQNLQWKEVTRTTHRSDLLRWCRWANAHTTSTLGDAIPASDSTAPNCWVVRAGRFGEMVEHNLANDVVSIGWGDWGHWGDIARCNTRDELGALIAERFADEPENNRRSARDQIWQFYGEINEGDTVVLPRKTSGAGTTSIAIGRIDGPFEFDSNQPVEGRLRRSVEWLATDVDRRVIKEDLWNSMSTPRTVFGLRRHDAPRRVLYMAEHGEDLGDGSAAQQTDRVHDRQERVRSAAFDLLCDVDFLNDVVALLEDKRQVILYGPPGTGKTYFARRLTEALAPDEDARSLVQFHPAYSYEDFFEGFRPVVDGGQMTYELTSGPLVQIAERAKERREAPHVMVIDEINRANLPRVLGELLYLLEYRDKAIQTQYRPDETFSLPENLWFIGTMNTADRSIALIDAAMRRRFHFVPFFPNHGPTAGLLRRWMQRNSPEQEWVAGLVDKVNKDLAEQMGGDHSLIGPSHFMRSDLDEDSLRRIWEYNIEPLIEDQLFGRQEVIESFRFGSVWRRYGPGATSSGAQPAEPDDQSADPANEAESLTG